MLLDLFKTYKPNDRPWLIAGMGPSFSAIKEINAKDYNILGINKVCREIKVEFCQIIDLYIIDKIGDSIYDNAKYLVMPYHPHFQCRPFIELTTEALVETKPLLKKMNEEKRLLCFNLSTIPFKKADSPIVTARYFSAEAAVSLLANLGIKTLRTIGVDGGIDRASEFSDHGSCDPRGFDIQWPGINYTIETFNLDYKALKGESDGKRNTIKSASYGRG
jgi:hypothetical protein